MDNSASHLFKPYTDITGVQVRVLNQNIYCGYSVHLKQMSKRKGKNILITLSQNFLFIWRPELLYPHCMPFFFFFFLGGGGGVGGEGYKKISKKRSNIPSVSKRRILQRPRIIARKNCGCLRPLNLHTMFIFCRSAMTQEDEIF